jgi:trk system potassium uptake protein TrkA
MKSFIVLGLGRFGISVAQTLYDMGYEVLGVDADEKIVNEFSRHIVHTVQADVTSEEFLKSMDVKRFSAAVVAVGSNIQVSIMATVLLKELGAKFILAKAQDDFQGKILYKLGADKVILPEKDIGIKVGHNLAADCFFDMVEISQDYSITSIEPPSSWHGKSIGQLAARTKHGVNILAVKGPNRTNIMPGAGTVIEKGSIITVMGKNDDLEKFSSLE